MMLGIPLPRLKYRRCLEKSALTREKVESLLCHFFQDCMVFKLKGDDHTQAMSLAEAHLFDPSGKGRAMKEWVQVPYDHGPSWPSLAEAAHRYVLSL
jgi:hypothetical protein